jgi:hypothetical protein
MGFSMPDEGADSATPRAVWNGLMGVDVAREVLRLLPSGFLREYEGLCLRAFSPLNGVSQGSPDAAVAAARPTRARTSTGQTETRGGAHNHKRQGLSTRGVIKSEAAVMLKRRIDRKLRQLARDIRAEEDQPRNEMRRCTRCRTFAEGDWLYCPRDGAPTEQVD